MLTNFEEVDSRDDAFESIVVTQDVDHEMELADLKQESYND